MSCGSGCKPQMRVLACVLGQRERVDRSPLDAIDDLDLLVGRVLDVELRAIVGERDVAGDADLDRDLADDFLRRLVEDRDDALVRAEVDRASLPAAAGFAAAAGVRRRSAPGRAGIESGTSGRAYDAPAQTAPRTMTSVTLIASREDRRRSCASPSARRRTSSSSRARGSADRAPAPARSSRDGSRTDRARPAGTGRPCRRCDRLPSPAKRSSSSRAGMCGPGRLLRRPPADERDDVRASPAGVRRRVGALGSSARASSPGLLVNWAEVLHRGSLELTEERRIPLRDLAVDLADRYPSSRESIRSSADWAASVRAVARVRFVIAAARAERPRPARAAVGLVGDVMRSRNARWRRGSMPSRTVPSL